MEKLLISCIVADILYLCIEDIRTKEVSNLGNLFLFFCSFLYSIRMGNSWSDIFVSAASYSFPLVFLYGYLSDFLQKEILGFGDIKFIMSVGIFMTSENSLWISIYYFYAISFFAASIVGIYLLCRGGEKELPMLPYFSLSLFFLKLCL